MTRSQFILGATLLCVSGTFAFMISFRHQEEQIALRQSANPPTQPAPRTSLRSQRDSPLLLENRPRLINDSTHYEVSVSNADLHEIGSKIERESKVRLQDITDQLQLTPNQRRQIFPLLVQHHADFTEGLIVNGQSTNPATHDSLATGVFPVLDLSQQETYQEAILADNEWWGEILAQFREDLDSAYERGVVDLVTSPAPATSSPLPTLESPATTTGGEIETDDVDLGNFFGN